MDTLLDKIKGCLVGGATGDALGYPVEFLDYDKILMKYGEEGITSFGLKSGGRNACYSGLLQCEVSG